METQELTFTLERETENTIRYSEDASGKSPAIGTLYVQKWLLGKLQVPWPCPFDAISSGLFGKVDRPPLLPGVRHLVLYGTGHFRLDDDDNAVRVGGVRYTIKDGIIYDARELLSDVREMVRKARLESGTGPGPERVPFIPQ